MADQEKPNRKKNWIKAALSAVLLSLAGLTAAGLAYESLASASAWRSNPPPGELVPVGEYRLHLHAAGPDSGSPAVVLENGATGLSAQWGWVQPEVARYTRVVSYDRPGMGWSDDPPHPVDARRAAQDLRTALLQAGMEGPYLLAGHSLGGLLVRVFAWEYPDEVAGLVLVDPRDLTWEGVHEVEPEPSPLFLRGLALAGRLGIIRLFGPYAPDAQGLPPRQRQEAQAIAFSYHHMKNLGQEGYLGDSAAALLAEKGEDLGDIPMIVLSAAEPGAGFDQRQREAMNALHARLAARSNDGEHRIIDGADHLTLATHEQYTPAVTEAILDLVERK
jgi:pimeloyl-ACP methyl ester carboxylesterase